MRARDVKTGVASSILQAQWQAAEIFPVARSPLLSLTPAQISLLHLFADPAAADTANPPDNRKEQAKAT